jgi:predicted GTPase
MYALVVLSTIYMETELLKKEEFEQHLKNKTLRLSFVGMSNAGKSYRSRILSEQAGFLWYQVVAWISIRRALPNA